MSNKYSEIMNNTGLNGKITRMEPAVVKEMLDMYVELTEKIHGENFRVGVDENGSFVGQKNNIFRKIEDHPHYSRFNDKLKNEIDSLLEVANMHYETHKEQMVFFGELYGNGLQKGFTWKHEGLQVIWFDVKLGSSYMNPDCRNNLLVDEIGVDVVPRIGEIRLRDALNPEIFNVEIIKSQIANEDFVEGVVATPLQEPRFWRFPSRLIVKIKTKKYAESKQKRAKTKPINNFVSEYVDFVTEARIDHAIQALQEAGVEIVYEMKDLQHLPKAVVADIEKEENDGAPLPKEDRKFLFSYIPKFYKEYLNKMLQERLQ